MSLAAHAAAPTPQAVASGLTTGQLTAWTLIALITTMMMVPLNALIPAFYAKHTAASMEMIGTILLIARLYDAVLDPAVGYLSDRTRSPLGRRKPWILAGGALGCLACFLLFNPAPDATGAYLLPVLLLFYTSYSMLIVPKSAWGSELSRSPQQRSVISGALTFAGVVGLLIFMGLPILLSSPLLPLFDSAEVTPEMLKLLGYLTIVLLPICVILPAIFTPQGVAVEEERPRFRALMASMAKNKPFRVYVAAYISFGLAYGVYYATTYLFIDAYLGMADEFPLVYATAALAQVASIPLWTKLCKRYERSRIWALGILAFGLLLPLRFFIPEGEWALPVLLVITVILSFANAASQVPQMAVLSDCIDYGTLKSRMNFAGSYAAVQQFVLKASLAAGGGIAFLLLAHIGFDAKAAPHTAASLEGLAAIHTFLPLGLFALCGALFWWFPLNTRRQLIVQRRLESRARRAAP